MDVKYRKISFQKHQISLLYCICTNSNSIWIFASPFMKFLKFNIKIQEVVHMEFIQSYHNLKTKYNKFDDLIPINSLFFNEFGLYQLLSWSKQHDQFTNYVFEKILPEIKCEILNVVMSNLELRIKQYQDENKNSKIEYQQKIKHLQQLNEQLNNNNNINKLENTDRIKMQEELISLNRQLVDLQHSGLEQQIQFDQQMEFLKKSHHEEVQKLVNEFHSELEETYKNNFIKLNDTYMFNYNNELKKMKDSFEIRYKSELNLLNEKCEENYFRELNAFFENQSKIISTTATISSTPPTPPPSSSAITSLAPISSLSLSSSSIGNNLFHLIILSKKNNEIIYQMIVGTEWYTTNKISKIQNPIVMLMNHRTKRPKLIRKTIRRTFRKKFNIEPKEKNITILLDKIILRNTCMQITNSQIIQFIEKIINKQNKLDMARM